MKLRQLKNFFNFIFLNVAEKRICSVTNGVDILNVLTDIVTKIDDIDELIEVSCLNHSIKRIFVRIRI